MKNIRTHFVFFAFIFLYSCSLVTSKPRVEYIKSAEGIVKKVYDSEGKLEELTTYKSDTLTKEGVSSFYKNGIVYKTENWEKNRLAGSYIEYIKGLPAIFKCYDSFGDTLFSRTYNGRRIIYESGNIHNHGTLDTDNMHLDSTVKFVSFIVKPPYTKIWVKKYIINLSDSSIIRPIDSEIDYDWVHYYTFKIDKPGAYKYKQLTYRIDSLRDSINITRTTDTVLFKF